MHVHAMMFKTEEEAIFAQAEVAKLVTNTETGVRRSNVDPYHIVLFLTQQQIDRDVVERIKDTCKPAVKSFNKHSWPEE